MKKEYKKPGMEIVSFAYENIATGLSVATANTGYQQNIAKITVKEY